MGGNGDKRSVSTDALETLGTIISEKEGRDAIHLAVNPTQAKQKLYPGQDVGVDGTTNNPVDIVDPFLKSPVHEGQWFWLVVYPRQITSLRHVWSHPAFPDAIAQAKQIDSERWLRDFCAHGDNPSYESVIEAVKSQADEDCRLVLDGETNYSEIPAEFWVHAENVLGRKIRNRAEFFSCTC